MKAIILSAAYEDIRDNAAWYDGKGRGLGKRFTQAVRQTIARIRNMPRGFEEIENGYRMALVEKYPYFVLYRIEDNVAKIAGVIHTSRDADVLEKRIN